ncbi:MAG: D-alanyl-D-alanine carboxypeptidase [Lachnospiraceae bacterium]|nr:D-alanyl-D-alanine carboxypeptidase [Candidatus Merdinaster equi]
MRYSSGEKSSHSRRVNSILNVLLALIIIFYTAYGTGVSAYAEESITEADLEAYVYSAEGAEVFTAPDVSTYYTSVPKNMIFHVTGITSNNFYRILFDNKTYYIYQGGVSTMTDTYAYKLLGYQANAAYAVDLKTGTVLFDQNSLKRLEPASTTKVLTALIVLEACELGMLTLDTPIAMTKSSLSSLPSDASHVKPILKVGEVLTVRQMLECLLISSDCHVADRFAEVISGSKEKFAALMNLKAAQLGCVDTNFIEPSGYPDRKHYTNAYSLALIAKEALKYPVFREIVGSQKIVIPATNLTPERILNSTNLLLDSTSPYFNAAAKGLKTGTANRAGACLITYGNDGVNEVITVILGSGTRKMADGTTVKGQFYESGRLLNYALVTDALIKNQQAAGNH